MSASAHTPHRCDPRAPELCRPATLRGRAIGSRLILPPMASATGSDDGLATAATLAHYERIVRPHHGIAFVEYSYVQVAGRSEPQQLGICTDAHEASLRPIAALMHERGVAAGIQLTHGGGKSDQPVGADAIPIPVRDGVLPAPRPMTPAELGALVDDFAAAAVRAERAGFDVIEVHAAHGYLLNQWLSPITNRRSDLTSPTVTARAQLLVRIVEEVRSAIGDHIVLSVRFAGQDRLDGGLELQDSIVVARALHAAGVDVLNVSSGLGGWRRRRGQRGEGYLVSDAARIRAATGIPVIGVGGIETRDYAERALGSGAVDFVAVGRAALSNPDHPLR